MDTRTLLPLALATLAYALVSHRTLGGLISVPLAFVALGLLLGDAGIGVVELPVSSGGLNVLAEITLALTLFTDASSINVIRLRHRHVMPQRLLGIGLPLTIAAGLGAALLLLPGLTLLEAALVAIILAPTDAALGQAVMTNRAVPESLRRTLNVESGLNDGLVFPLLLIVASIAMAESGADGARSALDWTGFVLAQLVLGPLTGYLVAHVGGSAVEHAIKRDQVSAGFLRLSTIALPLVAYAMAEAVGGNGFLAAFVCGLGVGANSPSLSTVIDDFAEAEGELLRLFVFFALGAVLLPATLPHMQWQHALYALLSLTAVRMLPVAVSLIGLGQDRATIAFLGWFGPRGLASVIYLLLLTDDYPLDAINQIGAVVLMTVMFSIVLHGLSATALASRFGAAHRDDPGDQDGD